MCVANELLTRVNLMKAYQFPEHETRWPKGRHCVVVGGGNVAMDALARHAVSAPGDGRVSSRSRRMPARRSIRHAEEEGVVFKTLTNPVRLIGDDEGWLVGAGSGRHGARRARRGRKKASACGGGLNHVIGEKCDMCVISIGNKTNPAHRANHPVSRRRAVISSWSTKDDVRDLGSGVFAGGDAVSGAATVILAMGAGKRAAAGIASYLTPGKLATVPKKTMRAWPWSPARSCRAACG